MEAVQGFISAVTSLCEANQLRDDLSRLRASLPRARDLIDRAEWGRRNVNVAALLSNLRDTTYDAEDLLREFDDQVERQNIEDNGRSQVGQGFLSYFNFLKVWMSGMKGRLREAQSNVDKAVAEIKEVLDDMGLNVVPLQPQMPETSSVIGVPEVFGRDEDRDIVIEKLGVTIGREMERDQAMRVLLGGPVPRSGRSARAGGKRAAQNRGGASTSRVKRPKGESSRGAGHVSVLPIVGIGGVGKTTLAQYIYNDIRVKKHFDLRMWVCVSDIFDKRKITKDIIQSIYRAQKEEFNCPNGLDALQVQLKEQLMGKKFLLVLDDVWLIASDEWEAFYAPFIDGLESSMVLVTTRFPIVADLVRTFQPIELKGLPTNVFWEFFKKCAFGKEQPESFPQLLDIGQKIADRLSLSGSPLAAKTLGRLLNMKLTEDHWRDIQKSELWELPQQGHEILPALQLSYLYLPQQHKKCFAVCSMFPKDYSFGRDEIVDFWVAQCFCERRAHAP